MNTARTIATADLRRRLRDRSAIIQGILAPIALALVVSFAFAGGDAFDFSIGIVDEDRSPTSVRVVDGLTAGSADGMTIVAHDDRVTAIDELDHERLDGVIVVPSGFETSLTGDDVPQLVVLVDPSRPIGGDLAESLAAGAAGRVDGVRLAAAAVPDDAASAAQLALTAEPAVTLDDTGIANDFDTGTYFAPSMAILFLFLTIGAGARSLLLERKQGTLTRLRSMPVPTGSVVTGKTAAVFVLGLVSFLVVYVLTSVGFGTRWGSPAAVLALIVATTGAIAALSMLVTGLARSDGQAESYTALLTFGLALLGGNFITPGAAPELLQRLALLTPNGWALDAFTDLSAGSAGVADVVPALAVLTVITIVAGTIGLALTNRQVHQ